MEKQRLQTEAKINLNKKQILIGFLLVFALIGFGFMQHSKDYRLSLHLIIGLLIGYIMQRSRFGFAGAVRKLYVNGDSSLAKALMYLFSISLLATVAIHYGAYVKGSDVYYRAIESGASIIPGSDYVEPANLATIIGGILFDIGMMFGGGCASGTNK